MFKAPPPLRSRHYELKTMVQTRSARNREEQLNTMKEDPGREIQSEIIKTRNVDKITLQERPKTDIGSLKYVQREKTVTSKSSLSINSIEARKKKLEFEAAQAKAEIEKQLIEKKLAADLAALESQASKSRQCSEYQKSEVNSKEKVHEWLEKSHISEMPNKVISDDVHGAAARAAGTSTDLQNLASAIYESNRQNQQMISRFATSKDLPPFHGDPLEWLAFKQAYEESSFICKYSDGENMWRLRKSLRGEAKETVAALFIGNTAPQSIMEALDLRYGRPDIIMNKITHQLKKIPPLSQNYHHEIVAFSIKIKNVVAAIQAVKQIDYLRSPELVTSVLSKCPSVLMNKWADYYCLRCDTNIAKLEILAEFLYYEANKISNAGISNIHSLADHRKKHDDRKHSVLLGSIDESQCKFCRSQNHTLAECPRFKRAMTKDRWRYVRSNKLCHKCMLGSHDRDSCSAATCNINECGLPHHRLLHWKAKNKDNENNSDVHTSVNYNVIHSDNDSHVNHVTVAHAYTSAESSILLKVVPINIHGPHGVVSTHALLDDGATVSLISADIADRVGLTGRKQTLCVRDAWNSELKCASEIVNCKVSNMNNDTYELCARKISELNLPSQKLSNINIENYEHLKQISGVIQYSENIKPKLLIGQDNYHLIAPIQTIIRNKTEPCATLTPLGWCVHGVCPARCYYKDKKSECALVTVVQAQRELPAPLAASDSPHACPRAALADCTPLPMALLTGASESSAASPPPPPPRETLTSMKAKECTSLRDPDDTSRHTDPKDDTQKSCMLEIIRLHNKDELKSMNILEHSAKLSDERWKFYLPWKDTNVRMTDSYCNVYRHRRRRRLKTAERKMAATMNTARHTNRDRAIYSPTTMFALEMTHKFAQSKTKNGIRSQPVTRLALLPMAAECPSRDTGVEDVDDVPREPPETKKIYK